jgi:hypothetical protein
MTPSDFELLVKEWVKVCAVNYFGHEHFGGSGDMGRDVVGWLDNSKCLGVWDNYQCKRLGQPLTPTDMWPELGKIFWHVSLGDYVMPRRMKFFCSAGIGTKAKHLLSNADKLRGGLLANWGNCVEAQIASVSVPLTTAIEALIQSTDFTIFEILPVDDVLSDISNTAFYISMFGGGFPKRPSVSAPPASLHPDETNYAEKLFAVYALRMKTTISSLSDLPDTSLERRHFNQMRRQFYSAEALNEFVRDLTEPGSFDGFQNDIFNGIWSVYADDHETAFGRLNKTLSAAANLPQGTSAIYLVAEALDKQGVCHQLANLDQLDWTSP